MEGMKVGAPVVSRTPPTPPAPTYVSEAATRYSAPTGAQGVRVLAKAGLAGLVIQGVVLSFAQRLVFPSMLAGWTGFGPMGVAVAIMTWCGVIGIGWTVRTPRNGDRGADRHRDEQ